MSWSRLVLVALPVVLPLAVGCGDGSDYDRSSDPRFEPYLTTAVTAKCEPSEGGKRMLVYPSAALESKSFHCERDTGAWTCSEPQSNPDDCPSSSSDFGGSWGVEKVRSVRAEVVTAACDTCYPAPPTRDDSGTVSLILSDRPCATVSVLASDAETGLTLERSEVVCCPPGT